MNAEIIGKDDRGIGVEISDQESVKHTISIGFEGEIQGHGQEGYPDDPEKRTCRGNEMVDQARDYAKWYVDQETDHDMCPWYLNCDRIKTVRTAIAGLSDDVLKNLFGEYYRQLAGKYDDEITRPHPDPVPAGEAMNRYREYKIDIYLTDDGGVDATSGVHTMYYAGVGDERLVETEDPYPDRRPDGRLEHVPLDISWEQFDRFVDYHLRCQLRDCYLSRGEEPPADYRVLGPGTDHMMVRCMNRDCLPPHHEYDADIDGYRAEDTFNAGLFAPLVELFG
jgi:hypothetical protein